MIPRNDPIAIWKKLMMGATGPLNDSPSPKPVIEHKWRWMHGDADYPGYSGSSKGKDCIRYNKPVYTEPGKVPGICRAPDCYNGEYYKKGSVIRDKNTKNIIREIPNGD